MSPMLCKQGSHNTSILYEKKNDHYYHFTKYLSPLIKVGIKVFETYTVTISIQYSYGPWLTDISQLITRINLFYEHVKHINADEPWSMANKKYEKYLLAFVLYDPDH